MLTKFDTRDNVWIVGTIESAQTINGKIYYKIEECEELIPESKCFSWPPEILRKKLRIKLE